MAGYKEIVLAAWLHDIGKFAQRADCGYSKNLEEQLCKQQAGGWRGHQHVLYTEHFLQAAKDCLPDDVQADEVVRLAAMHHNPSQYDEWIIAHGSRLSKGVDKCNVELESKNKNDETAAELYKKPLGHPLSNIRIKEKPEAKQFYCQLKAMADKAVFASGAVKPDKQEYQKVWQGFEKDFRALKGLKYDAFIKALDAVMERYCWCVPCDNADADVGLYQHSKTAAAFAGALYLYHEEGGTKTEAALAANGETAFLLVQGDMSGIQNYIFNLKRGKHNSKLLRAKSFQVAMLTEIVSEHLISQLGVSHDSVIASAGGKFLMLLPNTKTVIQKLPELRLELEAYFLREFAGNLVFVLSGGVPVSAEMLLKGKMPALFNAMREDAETAKQKKLQAVLAQDGHILGGLYEKLSANGECELCETLPAEADGNCRNCSELTAISGRLVNVAGIALKTEKLSGFSNMASIDGGDSFAYSTEYKAGRAFMPLPYTSPLNKDGGLCSFEEIAKKAEGNKKLAMFKVDVDNLGLLFASSSSLVRYAQLSRQLNYFFSVYVADFINSNTVYKNKIYTVFSGGDDLCIVGPWDAVMRFAADFRKAFSDFTGNNPSVTLSGGLTLADPRQPVRAVAAETENQLAGGAKKRKDKAGKAVKDGIALFDLAISWEEYEKCLEDAESIVKYMNSKAVSTAVVYKMIDFANRAQNVKDGNLRDMLWMSNYRYIIVRNINAKHEDALKLFSKFGVSPEAMEKSRIAVSFALYTNRKGEEE
jgi:CRISPR-associated protein Csm1